VRGVRKRRRGGELIIIPGRGVLGGADSEVERFSLPVVRSAAGGQLPPSRRSLWFVASGGWITSKVRCTYTRTIPDNRYLQNSLGILIYIASHNFSKMADPALELAETIQTASIKRDPSPRHDINPPTAASEKRPVARRSSSEADSIPSDIVDPSRMVRPVSRRHTLPPLPDLRFEQSYLASLRGADTWGRVAWITIRDQVRILDNGLRDLIVAM
jgi:hypothetical protein